MLADLVQGDLLAVLLVFARLGSALMLLPGFGEQYVFTRQRLVLAFLASALVAGALGAHPRVPTEPGALLALLVPEIMLGLAMGFLARATLVAAHIAGGILAMQSGLASAAFFDPNSSGQGTAPGMFLGVLVLTVLFASDGHLAILNGVAQSYDRFPMGAPIPLDDAAALMGPFLDTAFKAGLAIAAPLLCTTLLVNVLLATMGRMMPALQVFALAAPIQVLLYLGLSFIGIAGALRVAEASFRGTLTFLSWGQ